MSRTLIGAIAAFAFALAASPAQAGFRDSCETTDGHTICTGTVPTFIYYRMSAAKDYSGMIVPSFPLQAAAQVQVR